jgi:hypothetical protein
LDSTWAGELVSEGGEVSWAQLQTANSEKAIRTAHRIALHLMKKPGAPVTVSILD